MSAAVRTVVTFRSEAFNTTEAKSYFINDCCFGDDAARWIAGRLRHLGFETDAEPGQEDFGWYLGFRTPGGRFTLVLGYRPEEPIGDWIGIVERDCGFLASVFGGRNKGVSATAVEAVHRALTGCPEISRIAWHRQSEFDKGNEGGTASP
jgi:hypothetical protein